MAPADSVSGTNDMKRRVPCGDCNTTVKTGGASLQLHTHRQQRANGQPALLPSSHSQADSLSEIQMECGGESSLRTVNYYCVYLRDGGERA